MKKEQLYSIGEVSKITGLTVKTLRFYDKICLLHPYKVDPFTGYRYYHFDQFLLIDIIIAARHMQISPNDLVPLFKTGNTGELVRFLEDHKERTKQRIAELEQTLKAIAGIQHTLDASRFAVMQDGIYQKQIPRRSVLIQPFDRSKKQEELILDLSRLEISAARRGLGNTYESGILFENADGELYPAYLLTGTLNTSDQPDLRLLPGGNYVCIKYNEKEAEVKMNELFTYLITNGIQPVVLLQIELLGDLFKKGNELFELQALLPEN